MIVENHISEHLAKTKCHKCGTSLDGARVTPISKVPIAVVAHAICPNCLAESIVTITLAQSETTSSSSDLQSWELEEFVGQTPTSYEELFDLHKKLKRTTIWKLLQKSEKRLENKTENFVKTDRSRP